MRRYRASEFEKMVGRLPKDDDMVRLNCPIQGDMGHSHCGLCEEHRQPRFICGCRKEQLTLPTVLHPTVEQIKNRRGTLTQEQTAAMVHCTRHAWSVWETGERRMPLAEWELFVSKTS